MKTMLRQIISKWGIMSIDLQTAIDKDMAVIHEDGAVDYVDTQTVSGSEESEVVADQELREVEDEQIPGQMNIEDQFFS